MTVLLAYQRENCVLVASDLMLGKGGPDSANELPKEVDEKEFLPSEKFRLTKQRNVVAFAGNFDPLDLVKLYLFPIETFTKYRVSVNLKDSAGSLCYVDTSNAQVYAGEHTEILRALEREEFWISPYCVAPEREKQLRDIVDRLKGEAMSEDDLLGKISAEFERTIIGGVENEVDGIGGYHAQVITPGKRVIISKNFGKLQGLPEVEWMWRGSSLRLVK